MGRGLPEQLPRSGGRDYLVEDEIVAGVQVRGQQHVLFQPHSFTLLHLHHHVVDEERRGVIFGQDVDRELVADAMTAIADAEDDVVTSGVAVGVMVDDHAVLQVLHTEHEGLSTWWSQSYHMSEADVVTTTDPEEAEHQFISLESWTEHEHVSYINKIQA